jgi:hypothetical protein
MVRLLPRDNAVEQDDLSRSVALGKDHCLQSGGQGAPGDVH